MLALFDPQRLYSATPLRCRRTLEPLAARLDLPIAAEPAFDEPGPGEDIDDRVAGAAARLAELRDGERTVICSQGKVIPPLLALLDGDSGGGNRDPKAYKTPKGTGWVLCFTHDRLTALDRL